ncbi:MAG: adenosine deaminase family protein [Kiritimatiellia bacterium]
MISADFIRAIPKSELHVHLDGSLRLGTLIDLARHQGVALPSYEEQGLRDLVFKSQYANLAEYLAGFAYTCAVLRDAEALERVACELAEDVLAENVRYLEVRFAPQLHVARSDEMIGVLAAVTRGLERAARVFNASPAVAAGRDLRFRFGLIVCAMRNFGPGMSPYYDRLIDVLPAMPHKELVALASLEAARVAVDARDKHSIPVVGFDLAGEEAGFRAGHHAAAFQEAHHHFVSKTVHAGEAYGPESIYEAITRCHAERIGHGTWLFAEERILDPAIKDRGRYVERLAEYIACRRIGIEVCPTSNLQTMPELGSLANHPVRQMLAHRLAVSIGTDNRLVSHTTLSREMAIVTDTFMLDLRGVRNLVLAGFKSAFFPGSYAEKRIYVAQAVQQFERVATEMKVNGAR